jgi:hypothetical protein
MSLRIVACAGNFLSYWRDYRAEPEIHDDPDNRPAKQLTRIRLILLIALRDMDILPRQLAGQPEGEYSVIRLMGRACVPGDDLTAGSDDAQDSASRRVRFPASMGWLTESGTQNGRMSRWHKRLKSRSAARRRNRQLTRTRC